MLGNGSLYNHSDTPNADWIRFFDAEMVHIIAVRDIVRGQEITLSYRWDSAELRLMKHSPERDAKESRNG